MNRKGFTWPLICIVLLQGGASLSSSGQNLNPGEWRPAPPEHSKDLVERVYIDRGQSPAPSRKEASAGFIVYQRNYLDLIFTNSRPRTGERVNQLKSRLCPGEYEPLTFALYALRNIEDAAVSVSDLTSAKGMPIPSSSVDVRVVRSVFKRITHYTGPGEFMYQPSWLSAQRSTGIPAGQSGWFWLTVHAPRDAKPGVYRGSIAINIGGQARSRIPVSVEVLPIDLPAPKGTAIGIYDLSAQEVFWSLAERFRQMREHGMTSVAYCGGADLKLSLTEGRLLVDLDGSSLQRVMNAYRDAGFTEPILWLGGRDIYGWREKQSAGDSGRLDELQLGVYQAILGEAKKQKWPEVVIQPEDECPGHPERWRYAIRVLPLLQKAGFRTELNTPFAYENPENAAFLAQAAPHADVYAHGYSVDDLWGCPTWEEMNRRTLAAGKVAWCYNLEDAEMLTQPAAHRWMRGFFFRSMGAKHSGQFLWGYGARGDPYNDMDTDGSDYLLYYPADPERGFTGGPSINYECMREGVDDLRYVLALEQSIARARQSGDAGMRRRADKAQAVLDRITGSFDMKQMKVRKARWVENVWETLSEENGIRTATGSYTMPNGWSNADYDKARGNIIQAILGLEKRTGGR